MASPTRRLLSRPVPQNIKTQKNFRKFGAFFGAQKMWCNKTTLAIQFTTLTPQKHHTNSRTFFKIRHKNHAPPHTKKITTRPTKS
jgi:hypothetical protein